MKTLKQILEVYSPKSADEKRFVKKHITIKHPDAAGNGDDVFSGAAVKEIDRKKTRKGYNNADSEAVYEEEQIDELKKSTVASYIQKKFGKMSGEPASKNQYGYAKKDAKGIRNAGLRMGGIKATQKEEVEVNEVLKVSSGAGEWIKDFESSKNPKFAGKSKDQRKQQALAAYYSAKRAGKE